METPPGSLCTRAGLIECCRSIGFICEHTLADLLDKSSDYFGVGRADVANERPEAVMRYGVGIRRMYCIANGAFDIVGADVESLCHCRIDRFGQFAFRLVEIEAFFYAFSDAGMSQSASAQAVFCHDGGDAEVDGEIFS